MTSTSAPDRAARRATKRADPTHVSFRTLVAWSSSHAAQGANVLTLGFFSIYCTDTLGLSVSIVGLLLLLSRFADAIGALVAGWLVDITPETRFGKARPYDLAIVGIWVSTALMFSTPAAFGEVAKYVWVFATYLLVTAVFTPLFVANQPLYMARAFQSREVYSKLSARSGLIIGAVALAAGVGVPLLVAQAGKSPTVWSIIAISIAVPLSAFGLLRFFTVRERFNAEAAAPRVTFKDIGAVLSSNRYLWVVATFQVLASAVGNVGVGSYYFRYIVGNIGLLGAIGALNILALPLLAVLPALVRRFSISRVLAAASVVCALGYLTYGIAGANFGLLIVAGLLTAIGATPASFLLTVLIIDSATYNEWKGNRRLESVGGGVQSFAMSAGSGLAAGMTGLVLGAVGYDGTRATQTPAATGGIVALMSWVPAIISIAAAFTILYYHRLERRLPAITADIEARRATILGVPQVTPVSADPTAALAEAGAVNPIEITDEHRGQDGDRSHRG